MNKRIKKKKLKQSIKKNIRSIENGTDGQILSWSRIEQRAKWVFPEEVEKIGE